MKSKDNFIPYLDVLSEPSINMVRIYLIIRELQYNRSNRLVLSVEKLCFFNTAIANDEIVYSILDRNDKLKDNDLLEPIDNNLPFSHYNDIKEAIQGDRVKDFVIQMSCLEIIELSIINDEKILSIKNEIEINEKDPLICKWKKNINKLKFCVRKSERELYLSLLEASYE